MLDEILLPGFEVEFIVENRPLARRLHEAGVTVFAGDPRRTETWLKADLGPSTCVIIEDNGRRNPKKILEAVRDAGGTLVYVLGIGTSDSDNRAQEFHAEFPDVAYLSMSELFGGPLLTEFSRSLTRARVQQYQRYFSDADRVLIMLHNDPDPDAMASGLALRNVLRRTKATAIIGAIQGVTRPENLRMVNLLDIHVETITPATLNEYDRIAMVDVQPHYFGGLIDRVDLVIDHHPEQPGYTAVFKDIRPDYGSTSTILTEHLRAVDVNISERTATAMLYAIKSDTLFFNRQTNRVDLEAFSYLYPLADAGADPQDGGRGNHARAARLRPEGAPRRHARRSGVLRVPRAPPREDFIPYVADFFLQLEDVKWTVIAGIVERLAGRVGAKPRLHEERRRVRAPLLRRHRQRRRPPRDGQGGGADARVPGEVRRAHRRRHRRPAAGSSFTSSCSTIRPVREEAGTRRHQELVAGQFSRWSLVVDQRPATNDQRLIAQRLIEVGDEVGRILEPDREPQHAPRDARLAQLLVRVPPLRGQHRHADQALDAAEARGALDQPQPVVDPLGPVVAAVEVEADHAAEARHLPPRDLVIGMRRQAGIVHLADAPILREELGHRVRVRVVARDAQRQRLQPAAERVRRLRIHHRADQPPRLLDRRDERRRDR